MKYSFSANSLSNLGTCHSDLQDLFSEVVRHIDCTVIQGHREKNLQDKYYFNGNSKLKWPDSGHNKVPSLAADVVPCPIDWKDKKRFYYFAGVVNGIAAKMGIKIRWGGNWDCDGDLNDQSFMDLCHYELII